MGAYKTQSLDTSPEIEKMQFDRWRAMSDAEKMRQITSLTQGIWHLAEVGMRERYPTASEEEIRLRLAALRLDRETMIEVYDWDPKEKGY